MPRKKPFSGKQKKKQLQEKRNKREGSSTRSETGKWSSTEFNEHQDESPSTSSNPKEEMKNLTQTEKSLNPRERYRLHFARESRDEIERRKLSSQTEVLRNVSTEEMEVSIEEIFRPGTELDMPQRPPWNYGESKDRVESREEKYFQQYLENIHAKFQVDRLSYFEHNLETWRQLWRVLEMSDIVAMVADARHPVLHFSPALYKFVTETSKKPLILILNKIDLVPAPVVIAWKKYFERKFPQLNVITFSSFPKNITGVAAEKRVTKRRPVGRRIYSTQIGPQDLLRVCSKICDEKVDLSSWEQKIKDDLQKLLPDSDFEVQEMRDRGDQSHDEKFKDGKLTLGFVGHPNVGKSSLMNGLIGKKVVSTSVTPGHTKYFQTYFLTPTVMLCDSPGLVFPSLIDKQMQILSGLYPIAQVQEPYTPVGYLAARIPIIKLLGIHHVEADCCEWTAWDVCEAWAVKRRFYTAKGRRPDVYRAANNILRMAVDGRLCMFMLPPAYTKEEEKWIMDSETAHLLDMTDDPQKLKDLYSFRESFVEKELASTDSDSDDESDTESSNDHGDGKLSFENKFSLLVEEN